VLVDNCFDVLEAGAPGLWRAALRKYKGKGGKKWYDVEN